MNTPKPDLNKHTAYLADVQDLVERLKELQWTASRLKRQAPCTSYDGEHEHSEQTRIAAGLAAEASDSLEQVIHHYLDVNHLLDYDAGRICKKTGNRLV